MLHLRPALLLDAALTVLSAPTFLLGAAPLASMTGLPDALVGGAGVFLVAWALWFVVVLRHDPVRRGHVRVVLVVNVAWVVGCAVVAVVTAPLPPAGLVFVAGQAVAVGLLTLAQTRGVVAAAADAADRVPRPVP